MGKCCSSKVSTKNEFSKKCVNYYRPSMRMYIYLHAKLQIHLLSGPEPGLPLAPSPPLVGQKALDDGLMGGNSHFFRPTEKHFTTKTRVDKGSIYR